MPKLPWPPAPAALAAIPPEWRVVRVGTALFRVYRRGGPHSGAWNEFRFYGPLNGRFDPHEGPSALGPRGVLYAAILPSAALAEFFQTRRSINLRHREPWLAGFTIAREMRLLDLTGLWPTRAGASMALSSGPRPRARAWARAIYAAYPDAEGVWYGSSMHANTPCVALFERAADALPARPQIHRALADTTLRAFLRNVAADLNFRLIT
jgi:RES domain